MKPITNLLLILLFLVVQSRADTNTVIYPNVVSNQHGTDPAHIPYIGVASYFKTPTTVYGWVPDTNFTTFAATYTNDANVTIQIGGRSGDTYCIPTNTVSIPNPPYSSKYRFTVFYHVGAVVPSSTNGAPLNLTNLLP